MEERYIERLVVFERPLQESHASPGGVGGNGGGVGGVGGVGGGGGGGGAAAGSFRSSTPGHKRGRVNLCR